MQYGLEEARKKLLEYIGKAVAEPMSAASFPVVWRFKVPLIEMDPLGWMLCHKDARKIYFASANNDLIVAGIGAAFEVSSDGWHGLDDIWGQLHELMEACPEARIFTGMSFARAVSGVEWDGFGAIRCILPAVEVIKDKQGCWLVANMVRGRDGEPFDRVAMDILHKMYLVHDVSRQEALVVAREDVPDYEDWMCSAEAVLDAFERDDLQKVVLARRVTFELGEPGFPQALIHRLVRMESGAPSFLFAVDGKIFFPVSTEPLFSREGARVLTRILVNTPDHGVQKGSRAYQVVTGAVIEVYRELCRSYQIDCYQENEDGREMVVVSGDLNEGVIDKDFLQALHPAASVCGVPAEKARHFLQQYEVFDRGWFCGPVGFLSKDSVLLAVSSKACLLEEAALHLFAGASFIKGSDPFLRWEESGAKMKDIFNVVHGGLE